MTRKSTLPKWSDVKRQIADWEPRDLVALVKDLFDASPENRRFLAARFLRDDRGTEVLEPYRERIRQAFYKRSGWPQDELRLADARKAIREYRTATDDPAGVAELLVEFVETGTDFTLSFGDIDEPFYESLCSALDDLCRLFGGEGRSLYAGFRDRLLELARSAEGLGWGYGDHVTDVVGALETRASPSR